jgi:hypothetical protein
MRASLIGMIAAMLLSTHAVAQIDEARLRPWSEVESVLQAPGTMKYDGAYQDYWLSADGRLVARSSFGEGGEEAAEQDRPAGLGTWRGEGAWISFAPEFVAYPSEAALAKARQEWDDYLAELEAAADTEEKKARLAEMLAGRHEQAEPDGTAADEAMPSIRMLRVPYRGGELLVPEMALKMIALGWDGEEPLSLMPVAWRLPAGVTPPDEDGYPEFEIANPLSAGLPIELAGLLRRDVIEGSVVEVLDTPETLEWKRHATSVRVKLDRGANHGLYTDMDIYGLPPDEGFFAQVVEVKGEEAVATVSLSRFAPGDAVELPARGLRFATRRATGVGCHVDTSAALRAKVLAAATPAADAAWDADGFAFAEMTIDQGRRHGLLAGDRFSAEAEEIDGEGRVARVEAERAVVLWRVQRYDERQDVRWPVAGDALVTPAWQREAWDAFGSDAESE